MNKKVLIALGCIILVIILAITGKNNQVDWTPTFNEVDTKPLDTKVFYDQLPFWFKGQSTKKVHTTFYEYNQDLHMQPADKSIHNYISVSGKYEIDYTSFNSLLEHVGYGNVAFISAYHFPHFVKDTLGFDVKYNAVELIQSNKTLLLEHAKDTLEYEPKISYGASYIAGETTGKKLGYWLSNEGDEKINFIGVPYQDGIFYIHTTPEVFTNYQMLEASNTGYISTVISYLPQQLPLLIDKSVKVDPEFNQSPLRYILSKESLRWGWYLLLLAIGLFMLFNAKRRQRIIPIVEPLKNTTTEFVQTVSGLHYEAQDYNGIIQKKIIYFLKSIRSKYYLSTEYLNKDFVKKLAQKSGKPVEDIQRLISLVIKMKSHTFRTKEPLVNLNKEIEKFYKNNKPM